jgi:hypothetical protein
MSTMDRCSPVHKRACIWSDPIGAANLHAGGASLVGGKAEGRWAGREGSPSLHGARDTRRHYGPGRAACAAAFAGRRALPMSVQCAAALYTLT